MSGRNSAVECQLPKLDVAGSIPVARSKIIKRLRRLRNLFFALVCRFSVLKRLFDVNLGAIWLIAVPRLRDASFIVFPSVARAPMKTSFSHSPTAT